MAHKRSTKHSELVRSRQKLIYKSTPSSSAFGGEASAQPKVLNERQLRDEYGLGISWQRKARREGHGPHFLKIGRLVRYRRGDIEKFLSAHAVIAGEGRGR